MKPRLPAALATAALLLLPACRNQNTQQVGTSGTTRTEAAAGRAEAPDPVTAAQSSTADLFTHLASGLESHAFLVAAGVLTAAKHGFDGPAWNAAHKALDDNATALASTVGEAFGPDVAQRFKDAWTSHTGQVLAYARAKRGHDEAGAGQARELMERAAEEAGQLLGDAAAKTKGSNANATDFRAAVAKHVPDLATAIDTLAALASPAAPEVHHALEDLLTAASDLVEGLPMLVAKAAAAAHPDRYATLPSAPGVVLRFRLDHALEEHTYMTAILAQAVIDRGVDSDVARAADDTVEKTTDTLTSLVEPFFDGVGADEWKKLWQNEATAVRGYAAAKAGHDEKEVAKFKDDLDAVAGLVARFLAPRVEGQQSEWDTRMRTHTDALRKAVDALAQDQPDIGPLKDAADTVEPFGDPLSVALAQRHPDKVTG